VPRAFSATHVNLTHRNWTAVGVPGVDMLPIVDPAGLLTPLLDGWSLDAWVVPDEGEALLPSRCRRLEQELVLGENVSVRTWAARGGLELTTRAWMEVHGGQAVCVMEVAGVLDRPGWVVVSVRPANPEGVSFIHRIRSEADGRSWRIGREASVRFDRAPDRAVFSDYRGGDVLLRVRGGGPEPGRGAGSGGAGLQPGASPQPAVECDVGLATGAAMFRAHDGGIGAVVRVPLGDVGAVDESAFGPGRWRLPRLGRRGPRSHAAGGGTGGAGGGAGYPDSAAGAWSEAMEGACRLDIPDERMKFLYDAAVRTLVLHSPGDVYPGPYTYKRFWFRDAAFILEALMAVGLHRRAERVLQTYPDRQQVSGYFRSQEGEWDSNGEAIWTLHRYQQLTGRALDERLERSVKRGAEWIIRKRLPGDLGRPHAGLMPAGFSAEHLGPNDFYYWDDFWSVAGLESAAELLGGSGPVSDRPSPDSGAVGGAVGEGGALAQRYLAEAGDLREAIDASIGQTQPGREGLGVPASPYRRMDSGAVGSLACGYPLTLWAPDDPRLLATARFLREKCFVNGGFFQDMIHSGINAYLTLHVAQVLLRAGDPEFFALIEAVAGLASPTGQWPEAIHPLTGGGCMGDGQHVWAAGEWVLMLRNCFVREEELRGEGAAGGRRGLVIGSGIPKQWLEAGVSMGPVATPWGPVTVRIRAADVSGDGGAGFQPADAPRSVRVSWEGDWRDGQPPIVVRLRGFEAVEVMDGRTEVVVAARGAPSGAAR
jgi:hypothetical protein